MGMDWHMKKKKTKGENEDRISKLPDNLIHHILWFCDAQIAVQTSVLSKRWKLIWTTLPFLNFKRFRNSLNFDDERMFIEKFLYRRNNRYDVVKLNLYSHFHSRPKSRTYLVDMVISYSVSHNVRELIVDVPGFHFVDANKLSKLWRSEGLRFDSLKKLVLCLDFVDFSEEELGLSWHLPCLETLHLKRPYYWYPYKLSEGCFEHLPTLTTLLLDGFVLPDSISLPALTTLILHVVEFPENTSDMFYSLVNLRNLTLFLWTNIMADCVISCPQLVNLTINSYTSSQLCTIFVSSLKIQNFSSVGFLPIIFEVLELKNVNIKFGVSEFSIIQMIERLGRVRILTLTLDLKTIQALSAILDPSVHSSPPFHKLSLGHKQSSMSTYLKQYLLRYFPEATIVTALSQNNMIPETPRNVVLQEPLTDPTQVLDGSKNIHKTACIDTADKGVQEEHVLQKYAMNADEARQISAPVEGTSNYWVSSSRGDSAFRLWRGHEVNSEFVGLLDIIMNKYPETFEHFTTINRKLCTMKLNMLCTSVNVFTDICMNQVDAEMIAEHRTVFTALQNLGFNVSWLVNRLNFIEQLRFSQPLLPELDAIDSQIDSAKNELEDLQIRIKDLHTLRAEKMQEIQKAFGTMGANLLVGCIGDDLLFSP